MNLLPNLAKSFNGLLPIWLHHKTDKKNTGTCGTSCFWPLCGTIQDKYDHMSLLNSATGGKILPLNFMYNSWYAISCAYYFMYNSIMAWSLNMTNPCVQTPTSKTRVHSGVVIATSYNSWNFVKFFIHMCFSFTLCFWPTSKYITQEL